MQVPLYNIDPKPSITRILRADAMYRITYNYALINDQGEAIPRRRRRRRRHYIKIFFLLHLYIQ